ncbi:MAG: hypothetical protein WC277_06225 [Bacilli bacterium]|jgi:hypothetical protein
MKAKVSYGLGRTINTGNYENAKIDIHVEFMCEEDEVEQTYERAKKFVR